MAKAFWKRSAFWKRFYLSCKTYRTQSWSQVETPALTVNRLCGSGMEAIILAAKKIYLNEANVVLAGGSESMSQAPYVVRNARWGVKYGPTEFEDSLNQGLTDLYVELPMGMTAENLAVQYSISRQEQQMIGLYFAKRAEKATLDGILKKKFLQLQFLEKIQSFSRKTNSSEARLLKIRCLL